MLLSPSEEQTSPEEPGALLLFQKRPRDIHPALTENGLRAFTLPLAQVRRDVVMLADYGMSDDSRYVEYRAYAFGRQRLRRAAS